MRGKSSVFIAAAMLIATALYANGTKETTASAPKVQLTMGSWRTDDVQQAGAFLGVYEKSHPGVTIDFKPTNPPDYNATLRLQLASGTGPDLMYARSYDTGRSLYTDGYFADVSDVPGLQTNFPEATRAPWTMSDGKSFAIPFLAVSHGIYYNKDIFAKVGVTVPTTWSEFLATCQKLKDAGYTPIANSLGDEWDILEVFFCQLLPDFTGGRDGRLAYESGKTPWNDPKMVAAYQAALQLKPFLPKGFEALSYNDSSALFATEKAAMYFDGSWSIDNYKSVTFNWGVFAPPAPAGQKTYTIFQPDSGMAMNTKTKNPAQAKDFLAWLCTQSGASAAGQYLPKGFFPMINLPVTISDPHAQEFLALTKEHPTDVRFPWPLLMNGTPSGYNLLQIGVISVLKGVMTPQQAADNLSTGLAKWYKPVPNPS